MKAILIIGNNCDLTKYDYSNSYVIGVDRGAYLAYQSHIKLDLAIGDFDSLTTDEFNMLDGYTKITKLNPIKDDTDTLSAINLVKGYEEILIIGGIAGKRCEHFYANLQILNKYPNVKMIDDSTYIFTTDTSVALEGSDYKYASIFSISEKTIISEIGFKYTLDHYKLSPLDSIGISNEITEEGLIDVIKGRVIVILSKSDR